MLWRKSKSEVGGIVGGNGLTDWWLDTFSEDERELICERNRQALLPQPAHDTIAHGPPLKVIGSLAKFVSGWAAVGKLDHRSIDYRLIAKAEELAGSVTHVISRHFIFMHKAKIYYRWRDVDDFALEKAIEACRQQISIANKAATFFLDESSPSGLGFLPAHHGFKQLAIILEKDSNFEEALELCERAKLQGWNGDWDARLTRLRKKLAKRGQS